jgi:predicted AAA+ superfamily ATPase
VRDTELLPFSIAELMKEPLRNRIQNLIRSQSQPHLVDQLRLNVRLYHEKEKLIEQYLQNGGLPGVCFIRKEKLRTDKIIDQLRTILDRDLRQIYKTKLTFDELFHYLSAIASLEGTPYDYQSLKRLTGFSPITQKNLLYAFESIYLLRRLPIEGTECVEAGPRMISCPVTSLV